ncbi:ROK family transcriptional regulator [Cryobacterium sp. TMT1-2-2]|uniref:ROK family transcriptional regulator n=1 Tax=Cryobacterium sp. TMT1-2-2 TaxID=1259233 RepID=UPI00106B0760|nr:ROK family transcriptional regulator [Cryobacterium sp. TMT1-2-2]TFD13552.1 ROK family transcriptional regulator [Cryobacterium sp. TMT1-2-2]
MQGNNHDDVRRHNLSIILRLVHRGGAASRAQLTRLTGLNRSTIGALVAELVERGLVEERTPDPTKLAGRPSPIVAASDRIVAIAVNPEIDAITVGAVALSGVVHRLIRYATPSSPSIAEAVTITAGIVAELKRDLGEYSIIGIGVAVPGLVRASDGLVRHAPHLGWVDEPLCDLLAAATGLPVVAANDASLGVTAERYFGSGQGLTDLVYLNGGSSGIGGGLVIGGVAAGGQAGYAGEFGHTRVSDGIDTDSAGIAGTLEAEVTRHALLAALGLQAGETDADTLERALLASDSLIVRNLVNRQLDFLAIALASAVNMLNPQLIVLGGFLAALHAVDPERLNVAVAALTLPAAFAEVSIAPAVLGSNLLMIGAAELAFEALLVDPQQDRGNTTGLPPLGSKAADTAAPTFSTSQGHPLS